MVLLRFCAIMPQVEQLMRCVGLWFFLCRGVAPVLVSWCGITSEHPLKGCVRLSEGLLGARRCDCAFMAGV